MKKLLFFISISIFFITSLIPTSAIAQIRALAFSESEGIFGEPTVNDGKVRLIFQIKGAKKHLGGVPGVSRMEEDTTWTSLMCWCTDDIDIQEFDGKKLIPKEVYAKKGVQEYLLDIIGVLNTYAGRKVVFLAGGNGECKQVQFLRPETSKPLSKDENKELSVLEIQKMLKAKGFDPGIVDGKMGSRTIDAIKKFQEANKLPITGKVDEETLKLLKSKN